jgi:hypothetical protein
MLEKYYHKTIDSLLFSFKLSNAEPQFEDDYHYGNIPFKDMEFICQDPVTMDYRECKIINYEVEYEDNGIVQLGLKNIIVQFNDESIDKASSHNLYLTEKSLEKYGWQLGMYNENSY